jgi:histidine kinase
MKQVLRSLRVRLLMVQLAVVAFGVLALLVTVQLLAPAFFESHLESMSQMMGGTLSSFMEEELRDAFESSFGQALAVSVAVSIIAAVALSTFASRRILAPLESVREAARRMAGGSYAERVLPPQEIELAMLAKDVNALAEALDTTEQRRMRLIGEVAHELRTPLSTIEGYLEGLLDGVFEPDEEISAAVGREVRRLRRLAQDLSALSQAEEAAHALVLERIDLGTVAAEAANRLRPQFEAQTVTLTIEEGPSLMVEGDADRLAQVFTNIIGNALAYTAEGGLVRVGSRRQHDSAIVEIADNGRGLTGEQCTAVFERFFRVDPKASAGTGIGLTIARSIVRRHGGEVTAASPGLTLGSVFRVRIPLSGS